MELLSLTAIGPIDGRYGEKTLAYREIFSEFALIRFRYQIEIEWLLQLARHKFPDMPALAADQIRILKSWQEHFSLEQAQEVKKIESITNHDVKAVEYFLRDQCQQHETLNKIVPFIHLACTSEDINNLSYALMLKQGRVELLLKLESIQEQLKAFVQQFAAHPMLARTHGQAASPTTLGKEFANYYYRLAKQIQQFKNITLLGKCNGASGNYNAHVIAYHEFDWIHFSKNFVESLGLTWNPLTTQIEPHDFISELAHVLQRINTILIGFNRDIWRYIAIDYFQQAVVATEVGSSTMPHKNNPIDFENSEGNCYLANAVFAGLANNLPTSRWQRDLTDSTMLRNLGVGFAHCDIAYTACRSGLGKISPNETVIAQDLSLHWDVLAEAVQTVMRRYQLPDAYERLKEFTRGKVINQSKLTEFIEQLELPMAVKKQLQALTPSQYTGKAEQLCRFIDDLAF